MVSLVARLRGLVTAGCLALSLASFTVSAQDGGAVSRYQSYLAAIAASDSLLDLTPYMSASRSLVLAREIESLRLGGANIEDIERTLLAYLKASTRDPATITPYVIGDTAALVIERANSTLEIEMRKEKDVWVIVREQAARTYP